MSEMTFLCNCMSMLSKEPGSRVWRCVTCGAGWKTSDKNNLKKAQEAKALNTLSYSLWKVGKMSLDEADVLAEKLTEILRRNGCRIITSSL